MPVYGIIRVSTTEQAAEGRTSLDDQRTRITGAAMTNGWGVDRIYSDEGVSGSTPLAERPEGGKLVRALALASARRKCARLFAFPGLAWLQIILRRAFLQGAR